VPDDTLVLALSGTISHKREQPSPGPFELATADGSAIENAGTGGVNAGGVGGTGCRGRIARCCQPPAR
jgi:hypothetical protein